MNTSSFGIFFQHFYTALSGSILVDSINVAIEVTIGEELTSDSPAFWFPRSHLIGQTPAKKQPALTQTQSCAPVQTEEWPR